VVVLSVVPVVFKRVFIKNEIRILFLSLMLGSLCLNHADDGGLVLVQ
jgi:hypothetical protein